jgi:Fe-S cluster biogenesis protein NfuA
MDQVMVELEFTPNPNTLKYTTSVPLLLTGAANFTTPEAAQGKSPLAEKLFGLKDISAIMVGRNFVTVTLANQEALTEINEQIIDTIKTFLEGGGKALNYDITAATEDTVDRTETEKKIIKILDEEIRPAVAMDGGDITFEKYEGGVVFLHMKGACAGCPSSTATLKMGIENRLKDAVPEITEIVAI